MEFLQGALNSPDESLRCGALEATTSMQVQPAFVGAAIVAGLRSDSSAVRKAAIDALGFLRGEALTLHREKLKALAESHDPAIAEAVRRKVSE